MAAGGLPANYIMSCGGGGRGGHDSFPGSQRFTTPDGRFYCVIRREEKNRNGVGFFPSLNVIYMRRGTSCVLRYTRYTCVLHT